MSKQIAVDSRFNLAGAEDSLSFQMWITFQYNGILIVAESRCEPLENKMRLAMLSLVYHFNNCRDTGCCSGAATRSNRLVAIYSTQARLTWLIPIQPQMSRWRVSAVVAKGPTSPEGSLPVHWVLSIFFFLGRLAFKACMISDDHGLSGARENKCAGPAQMGLHPCDSEKQLNTMALLVHVPFIRKLYHFRLKYHRAVGFCGICGWVVWSELFGVKFWRDAAGYY